MDGHTLDIHWEWCFGEISKTTSPLHGSLRGSAGATDPVAHLYLHRSLREVLSSVGITIGKSADNVAIDGPFDSRAGPVNGVGVKLGLRRRYWNVGGTVISGGISFPEIVCLNLSEITTKPFLHIMRLAIVYGIV